MICVSLQKKTFDEFKDALAGLAFAEIRLDEGYLHLNEVTDLFRSHPNLVAACRPGGLADAQRQRILATACQAGAAYVDVEVDAGYADALVALAASKSCKVIVSFHDDQKTPPLPTLISIRDRCFEQGADIAKIACRVHSLGDCARLIALLDCDRPVIPVGMGPVGKICRIVAPLLGAPFMYASRTDAEATADGQIEAARLAEILKGFRDV